MTQLNAPATPTTKGFSAPVLGLIEHAQRLNKWSIYLVYLAIALFLVFGTLKSLSQFKDSQTIYTLFHWVPY